MRLFHDTIKGTFLHRPNRFIITADTAFGRVTAHCPNPGRLQEIFTPGARVLLEKSADPDRKTRYSLAAGFYKNKVIPLNSAKANLIAEKIFIPHLYPQAGKVEREYSLGNSRFDFLITEEKRKILLEVKACTLVYEGTAMFPDAPTIRGTKHIRELEAYSAEGYTSVILFVIMHGDTERFIPNIHTDPVFSEALEKASANIAVKAVSLSADEEGIITPIGYSIPKDPSPAVLCRENRGIYLLCCSVLHSVTIDVGALGPITLNPGYYIYTGSGMGNLTARISRHLRKGKKKHWHIDYLCEYADRVKAYPIYTSNRIECLAADLIRKQCDEEVPSFGCSDCSCTSHLFFFRSDPFNKNEFLDTFLHLRHTLAFS